MPWKHKIYHVTGTCGLDCKCDREAVVIAKNASEAKTLSKDAAFMGVPEKAIKLGETNQKEGVVMYQEGE